jgi:ribonuclease P protein component
MASVSACKLPAVLKSWLAAVPRAASGCPPSPDVWSRERFQKEWPVKLVTLKKRSEFLRIRGGARWSGAAFVLETKPRDAGVRMPAAPRFGFTVTKKLGNAVTRNRIRRRLKAALTSLDGLSSKPGHDYVVIARTAAGTRDFEALKADFITALKTVHSSKSLPGKSRQA